MIEGGSGLTPSKYPTDRLVPAGNDPPREPDSYDRSCQSNPLRAETGPEARASERLHRGRRRPGLHHSRRGGELRQRGSRGGGRSIALSNSAAAREAKPADGAQGLCQVLSIEHQPPRYRAKRNQIQTTMRLWD